MFSSESPPNCGNENDVKMNSTPGFRFGHDVTLFADCSATLSAWCSAGSKTKTSHGLAESMDSKQKIAKTIEVQANQIIRLQTKEHSYDIYIQNIIYLYIS